MTDERLNGELQQEIRKFQEAVFPTIPKEIVETLLRTTEDQVRSGIAARALDEGASGTWELPIPATYVIDPSGTIRLAFVDADYTKRLEPAAILDALRRIRGA